MAKQDVSATCLSTVPYTRRASFPPEASFDQFRRLSSNSRASIDHRLPPQPRNQQGSFLCAEFFLFLKVLASYWFMSFFVPKFWRSIGLCVFLYRRRSGLLLMQLRIIINSVFLVNYN